MKKLDLTEEERRDYKWLLRQEQNYRFDKRHPGRRVEYCRNYNERHPGRRNEQAAAGRARLGKEECNRRNREWNAKNPDRIKKYRTDWRQKNPNWMHNYYVVHKKDYVQSKIRRNAIPEKKAKYSATAKKYRQNVRKNDPQYKIKAILRGRIKMALKLNALGRAKKAYKTEELLGCTVDYFKSYIAAQFKSGMTWENHAHHTWHLDHRIACKHFDLRDPEQQKRCFHHSNYQPLFARPNLQKGTKFIDFPATTAGITQPNKARFSPERAQLGNT